MCYRKISFYLLVRLYYVPDGYVESSPHPFVNGRIRFKRSKVGKIEISIIGNSEELILKSLSIGKV